MNANTINQNFFARFSHKLFSDSFSERYFWATARAREIEPITNFRIKSLLTGIPNIVYGLYFSSKSNYYI